MGAGAPRVFAVLATLLAIGGCRRPEAERAKGSEATEAVVDANGDTVRIHAPARKIISLVPSATLTLHVLGADDLLVARTDYDTASWAVDLPSVGGGLEPSLEAVVAQHPDLVIRFGGPQDTRTPARLTDLGVPTLAIRPDDVASVLGTIGLLGRISGHQRQADSLVTRIRGGLDSIRSSTADLTKVRTAYVLGGSPPWVAGPGTYISDLIELGGGTNVFSDLGSLYAAVSPEEFLSRRIDVILLAAGSRFDRALARGVPILEVDPGVERPGPDLLSAARDVASLLQKARER